jgi:hypothetical protein
VELISSTVQKLKMTAAWDVAPCNLVKVTYTDISVVRATSMKMEAVRAFEASYEQMVCC